MSSQVPSTQRPIPMQGRNDLVVERVEYRGVGSWVIKDPVALKYHRLQPEQYKVLRLLDGHRNLEQIRDGLQSAFPTLSFAMVDLQHLITDLHNKRLVYSNRPGRGPALVKERRKAKKKKFTSLFKNILYLRLPGWDPEPTLRWMYPLTRWMFHPWAIIFTLLFVSSAYVLLAVKFDQFYSQLPEFQQFFGWPNLIYLWFSLGLAKIIHEFGHGLSCKHFGGECHEMGVMLLVFSPCLYCDASDSWMLKNKWQRFAIGGAGMYIEAIISALSIYGWWYTQPGLLNHLCLNVFFVTAVSTVIFNANPLMRFDGYYMMSDFLEIPNLRPKSDKMLREKFSWYCLGIETRPDPFMPETGKIWFVAFAIAASIYRWFILFGITLFLYTVLKPYDLQSIGIFMAVVSMAGIVSSMAMNVYRILAAPRTEPLSKPKIFATLTVLASVILAAIFIPLPLRVESSFLIEPYEVRHVYVTMPGELVELHVEPGNWVDQDYVLARLLNEELEDQYDTMLVDEKVLVSKVALNLALQDNLQKQITQQELESKRTQIKDFEKQMAHLTITSPVSGRVVAPPRIARPKLDLLRDQLATFHGTPLDPRNANCFLEERTHLLSIAPSDRLVAILLLDQGDRNDVEVGQIVEIMFEHLPDRTYSGTIEKISIGNEEFAPQALSNKGGGELSTVTDASGREKLTSTAYQATVLLDEDAQLLKAGMRGKTRFVVDRRSAWDWTWRYITRTFRFRL
jgi:putative peptide zinc metalloprotease protein